MGITGHVRIDDNGDRDADYSILDLDPITGRSFKIHTIRSTALSLAIKNRKLQTINRRLRNSLEFFSKLDKKPIINFLKKK